MRRSGKKTSKSAVSVRKPIHDQEHIEGGDILAIVEKHAHEHGGLIAVLGGIQEKYGYLPEPALRILSEKTGRSLADIYGVATFYRSFTLRPRGEHLVTACLGTACHVRGAARITEELERQLGIKAGETTPDRTFTLETVNCLGACALGPVVVIDGHYFSKVRKSQISQLLADAREGAAKTELEDNPRMFPIEANCIHCLHSLMDKTVTIDRRPSIRLNASFDGRRGWFRISSLYGSHSSSSDQVIPQGTVATLSCPRCGKDLIGSWECMTCGAPMALLAVGGGGVLQVCTRGGCKGRMLDIG